MEEKIMPDSSHLITVPVGKLGIIPLESCKALGEKQRVHYRIPYVVLMFTSWLML